MVFFLKEREAIEPNHFICNPVGAQKVADSLRHEQYDL